jgi:UDP-N-acetylmuramoyl-L-alanyl-D-glutamate--2,6-diaminopimelate ligase
MMIEGETVFNHVSIEETRGRMPKQFAALTCDSRAIGEGDLFVALRGDHFDGHAFINDVCRQGAAAAVVEHFCAPETFPQIRVQNTLASLARIAANFYHHPAQQLSIIGITGSNGKTTSSYLLEAIFKAAGEEAALIGTIEYRFCGERIDAPNTTPLSHELQHLLRRMADAGNRRVVMEVSSHGLVLHRLDEISFDVALFTNLSQDHLDFHKTMQAYSDAKKRIFTDYLKPTGTAVINVDDDTGRRFIETLPHTNLITFGISHPADIWAKDITIALDGNQFTLVFPNGIEEKIHSRLVGQFNIFNVLGAAAAAWACELPVPVITQGIETFTSVPGRLEPVPNSIGVQILVDYCHTPDALEKCLETLQRIPHNRMITLVGCGGDRDKEKRPLMGEVAGRLSDWVIVTDDNPRSEDSAAIIKEIEKGLVSYRDKYEVIPNRAQAIQAGISRVETNDIFLLAGKGHETYQIIGGITSPFDDRKMARKYVSARERGTR